MTKARGEGGDGQVRRVALVAVTGSIGASVGIGGGDGGGEAVADGEVVASGGGSGGGRMGGGSVGGAGGSGSSINDEELRKRCGSIEVEPIAKMKDEHRTRRPREYES